MLGREIARVDEVKGENIRPFPWEVNNIHVLVMCVVLVLEQCIIFFPSTSTCTPEYSEYY
jgi:hypothetical protein